MDLDPEVTSSREVGSQPASDRDALPPTENVGQNLLKGRYLLGPELGRGGFAITYLAADLEIASRKVVVKVLNFIHAKDPWSLKKFRSEMEALARIHHPNVVSVLDFGYCDNGKPFLVMQYVPGRRLREMIPRDGLPLAFVADVLKQVGRALTAAHEVGVCHRDVKPENIMIGEGGGPEEIKLIDFGIASIREPGEDVSSTASSGTYTYMSPEQFEGKVSPASDVYQMGVVAYELVTGIAPFRAGSAAGIVLQHMDGLKVLPRALRPDLPENAEEYILKALSPDPRDRFERAREFGDALAAALVSSAPPSAGWVKTAQPRSTRSRRRARVRRRLPLWAVAVLLAVACVCAYLFVHARAPAAGAVAVLPFENRTGDPRMAYLAAGITESLINDLSRIPTLRVSARGAVLKYDRARVDARAAGRELRVSRIIDGSISQQGDDFFLDTELIDTRTGVRLWGNAYSGKISSLAEVLEQFSTEVTDELRLKLSEPLKARLRRQYAIGSEAYQQYLKGRYYLNKRSAADFQLAIHYFNQAIASDPNYAPAYAGLADSYGVMAAYANEFGGIVPVSALEQSRAAAHRALELDGTLAEAYNALAWVELQADYNWEGAERDFLRSIRLNPNWPDVHENYALELAALGRFEDALGESKTAENADPSSTNFRYANASILYMARRFKDSLALVVRAVDKSTGTVSADMIAENYWAMSMPTQALEAARQLTPEDTPIAAPLLAAAYARVGRMDAAKRVLHKYAVQPDTGRWYYLALAHLSLGQTEDAMNDLEAGYRERGAEAIFLAVDPMFDGLRTNARFHQLLEHLKLEQPHSQAN